MTSSVLDQEVVSGRYLFPQPRAVSNPFLVPVSGAELSCYRRVVDPQALTLVHFHGNGEAVADYVPNLTFVFERMGFNTLFVEYREYGGSTGKAQLVAMLDDGESALNAAGIPPEKAVVFGRSIGSLYAIELASRLPTIAGLILESGIADPCERFLKYADFSQAGVTQEDVVLEAQKYFDQQAKLSSYHNPLLLLHTEQDGLVDISHAERNFEWAASERKQLIRFPMGDHNSILPRNLTEYIDAVHGFIESL